jgi:hypothetical protein
MRTVPRKLSHDFNKEHAPGSRFDGVDKLVMRVVPALKSRISRLGKPKLSNFNLKKMKKAEWH